MSGFVAIYNTDEAPADRGLLEVLTESLHVRGPDGQHVWTSGSIGLGHTLYQTSDEAEFEYQPATIDGISWIAGSIRVDGRKDIAEKLGIASKIMLKQTPDHELVLHAYQKWGERCTEHLLGDFAFAIWDKNKSRLFCAKDHFGMRQLYYTRLRNSIVVSNSLKCMLAHPEISNELNNTSIAGFLLFGDHTWLDKSITAFSKVNVLPPAHSACFQKHNFRLRNYWELPAKADLLTYKNKLDYVDHFREVFTHAVRDRVRTDKITVSLSGGLDSSAVAATAKAILHEKYVAPEISAATVIYRKIYHCEEKSFAALTAKTLGIPIHYMQGDNFPLIRSDMKTTRPLELNQPELWLAFERKKGELGRITLTGDAADNLLHFPSTSQAVKESGITYVLSTLLGATRKYGRIPGIGTGLKAGMRRWKNKNTYPAPYPYPSWLNPDFQKSAGLLDIWDEMWAPTLTPTYKKSRSQLLKESLLRPDWTNEDFMMESTFTPTEHNDPYLDLRLVCFVHSLPSLPWLFNKDILRLSMVGTLPDEIVSRPKTPLGSIQKSFWKEKSTAWLDEWEAADKLAQYVDRSRIPKLTENKAGHLASYVNLRPVILNEWLRLL